MRYTSTALALVLAATAAPAFAQTQWTFADIDTDGNLELSSREFAEAGRTLFVDLDRDENQILDENELAQLGTADEFGWNEWDIDGDGVDLTEFNDALYGAYDADGSGAVAEQEFAQADTGVGAAGMADAQTIEAGEIVPISGWGYDDLYAQGVSVEDFIDEVEVWGVGDEEIGNVEDVIFGSNGEVLAVIAEVGGFWDIGDTHVSIPWDQVEWTLGGDNIVVPVTEENVEDYGLFANDMITAASAGSEVITDVDDDPTGPRAWRATELIGDYARLRDGDGYMNYGYVNDVLIQDGQIAAVLVNQDAGWGYGTYGYPYSAGRWNPGSQYYDLPYTRDEVGDLEPFEYDRMAY